MDNGSGETVASHGVEHGSQPRPTSRMLLLGKDHAPDCTLNKHFGMLLEGNQSACFRSEIVFIFDLSAWVWFSFF